MAPALSEDPRARAVDGWESGQGSPLGAAKLFGVGELSLRRWVRLKREAGSLVASKAPRGERSAVTAEVVEMMPAHLLEQPDAARAELAGAVDAAAGPRLPVATVGRAPHKAGWPRIQPSERRRRAKCPWVPPVARGRVLSRGGQRGLRIFRAFVPTSAQRLDRTMGAVIGEAYPR